MGIDIITMAEFERLHASGRVIQLTPPIAMRVSVVDLEAQPGFVWTDKERYVQAALQSPGSQMRKTATHYMRGPFYEVQQRENIRELWTQVVQYKVDY